MSTSGDSAESIVRMMLNGSEVILKITGSASKNIAMALYVMSKEQKNSKGKTNLSKMLNTKKECKVFSIKEEDLKEFTKQAKAYGVLFCALVNKKEKSKDGMVDLMVKAEDASKVNRIITRYKMVSVDRASLINEAKEELSQTANSKTETITKTKTKTKTTVVEESKEKELPKEVNATNEIKEVIEVDPKLQGETEKNQSENLLNMSKKEEEVFKKVKKPSVKEKLASYKDKSKKDFEKTKNKEKDSKIKTTKKKSKKKNKER